MRSSASQHFRCYKDVHWRQAQVAHPLVCRSASYFGECRGNFEHEPSCSKPPVLAPSCKEGYSLLSGRNTDCLHINAKPNIGVRWNHTPLRRVNRSTAADRYNVNGLSIRINQFGLNLWLVRHRNGVEGVIPKLEIDCMSQTGLQVLKFDVHAPGKLVDCCRPDAGCGFFSYLP